MQPQSSLAENGEGYLLFRMATVSPTQHPRCDPRRAAPVQGLLITAGRRLRRSGFNPTNDACSGVVVGLKSDLRTTGSATGPRGDIHA